MSWNSKPGEFTTSDWSVEMTSTGVATVSISTMPSLGGSVDGRILWSIDGGKSKADFYPMWRHSDGTGVTRSINVPFGDLKVKLYLLTPEGFADVDSDLKEITSYEAAEISDLLFVSNSTNSPTHTISNIPVTPGKRLFFCASIGWNTWTLASRGLGVVTVDGNAVVELEDADTNPVETYQDTDGMTKWYYYDVPDGTTSVEASFVWLTNVNHSSHIFVCLPITTSVLAWDGNSVDDQVLFAYDLGSIDQRAAVFALSSSYAGGGGQRADHRIMVNGKQSVPMVTKLENPATSYYYSWSADLVGRTGQPEDIQFTIAEHFATGQGLGLSNIVLVLG